MGLLRNKYSIMLFRAALVVYVAILTYYSLIPQYAGGLPTAGFSMYDLHIVAYLGMSILVLLSFPDMVPSNSALLLVSVFLYSALIEIVQMPIPGRFFSWYDLLMNGFGTFLPALFTNSWFYSFLRNLKD